MTLQLHKTPEQVYVPGIPRKIAEVRQLFNDIISGVRTLDEEVAGIDPHDLFSNDFLTALPIRPGDAPALFADTFAGKPWDLAPTALSPTATAEGNVLRRTGAGTMAARGVVRLEEGRLYYLRAIATRRQDTSDPDNHAVALCAAWLDRNMIPIVPASSRLVTELDMTVASGRTQLACTVSTTAGSSVMHVAPAGAVYMRAFLQTFGDDAITDIEVISQLDVTDSIGDAIAADLVAQAIEAAATATQAANEAVAALEGLEASLWPPMTVAASGTVLPVAPGGGYRFLNLTDGSLYVRNAGNTAWTTAAPLGGEHLFDYGSRTHFQYSTKWIRRSPRRITCSEFPDVPTAEAFRAMAGARELLIDCDWLLTQDEIIAAPLTTIAEGCLIDVDDNHLTMGWLGNCPRDQIFDISGGGTVTLQRAVGFPEWFGAVGDGETEIVTDVTSAGVSVTEEIIRAGSGTNDWLALDAVGNCGVSCVELDRKIYLCSPSWQFDKNMTVRGAHPTKSIIAAMDNENEVIFCHNFYNDGGDVTLRDFTVWGFLDRLPVDEDPGPHKAVQLELLETATCENITVKFSVNMSITMVAGTARANKCKVYKSCRDGINCTGSGRLYATKNRIDMCGDDAIAYHVNSSYSGVFELAGEITGNQITKSFAISSCGGRQLVIANNQGRFLYGHGVFITTQGTEGNDSKWGTTITGNSFTDVIDNTVLGFSGGQQAAIVLAGTASLGTGGTAVGAIPENYNATLKAVQSPYPWINQAKGNGSLPCPPSGDTVISGNSMTQTLEGLTNFSDAGFGNLWNGREEVDPEMTGTVRTLPALRVDGDIENLIVSSNTSRGHSSFMYMNPTDIPRPIWRNVRALGNTIFRTQQAFVFDHLSQKTYIDMVIADNDIDVDPFWESPNRHTSAGAPNGTWEVTNTRDWDAFDYQSVAGIRILRNSVKNVQRVEWTNGNSQAIVADNDYFWDWSEGVARGIGTIQTRDGNNHFYVFSDPSATTTYGKTSATVDSAWLRHAAAMPTAGQFVTGQFVENTAKAIATGEVLQGWDRLTYTSAGTEHTLGVDWAARYSKSA